jgi:hypothetical protein
MNYEHYVKKELALFFASEVLPLKPNGAARKEFATNLGPMPCDVNFLYAVTRHPAQWAASLTENAWNWTSRQIV